MTRVLFVIPRRYKRTVTAAAARDEELDMLRLLVDVTRAEARDLQDRVDELEIELSVHSIVLGRLLAAL